MTSKKKIILPKDIESVVSTLMNSIRSQNEKIQELGAVNYSLRALLDTQFKLLLQYARYHKASRDKFKPDINYNKLFKLFESIDFSCTPAVREEANALLYVKRKDMKSYSKRKDKDNDR